jgi:hypothetical protein
VNERSLKKCSKCGEEKSLSEFSKDKSKPDGYYSSCKDCSYKWQRNNYLKNKDKVLQHHKEYYLKTKDGRYEKYKITLDAWRKSHRKEINAQQRNRSKIDINFRLSNLLRNRIYSTLKGLDKSQSSLKLLGCSVEFFRNYLESQFKPGMTWDNQGRGCNGKGMQEWHIDHIKPCASFDLSNPEEQKKCYHYTNQQPLWAKINRKKQDNYAL